MGIALGQKIGAELILATDPVNVIATEDYKAGFSYLTKDEKQ